MSEPVYVFNCVKCGEPNEVTPERFREVINFTASGARKYFAVCQACGKENLVRLPKGQQP